MLKYKDYKLTKLSPIIENQINELILTKNGSVFHEPQLNKIISDKFNTKLFYLVDNPQNIKSASVVHITKNKFGFKRYNLRPLSDIPYSGFVGESNIDFNNFKIGINESISYVGFPYLKGKDVESESGSGETVMVDLKLSEDDIFKNVIHSKRRNMIRKALKSDITIKTFFNTKGLDIFWPILAELHHKLGYEKLDYQYYSDILSPYFNEKKAFVSIAFKNSKPISGVIILGNRNYMHYYKGAAKMDVKNEGQGELLQWEAIKHSKQLGAKYYDLCNLNKDSLPHIYKFKTGISKEFFNYQKHSRSTLGYRVSNRFVRYFSRLIIT